MYKVLHHYTKSLHYHSITIICHVQISYSVKIGHKTGNISRCFPATIPKERILHVAL